MIVIQVVVRDTVAGGDDDGDDATDSGVVVAVDALSLSSCSCRVRCPAGFRSPCPPLQPPCNGHGHGHDENVSVSPAQLHIRGLFKIRFALLPPQTRTLHPGYCTSLYSELYKL